METVIIIIMSMVGFNFLLKLTYHGWTGRIIICLAAAIFIICVTDIAASQSKTQIADWLSQTDLMLDSSVWLTIDVAFQICFCLLAAKKMNARSSRRELWAYDICLWVPGLLIFPVLFASLTALIFSLPGTDFDIISLELAAAVLAAMPLLAHVFKTILPEHDLRLELMFMINLLTAGLGIVATVNGRTAAVGTNKVEWDALAATLSLLALGLITGIIIYKTNTAKQISKIQ